MGFGQNWLKIDSFKHAFYPVRTVQGAILGYVSLRRRINHETKFPSKSAINWE